MEATLIALALSAVSYAARCLTVWIRVRAHARTTASQHQTALQMVPHLRDGTQLFIGSANGDVVTVHRRLPASAALSPSQGAVHG